MKKLFRSLGIIVVKIVGRKITDYKNGEHLGKAIIIVWGGKIHIIGYTGHRCLLVDWLPQEELTYWRARLGFTTRNNDK